MNHKERMEQGLIYNPNLPEITGDQFVYMDKLWEFNQLKPSQFAEKRALYERNVCRVRRELLY